MQRSSDLHRFLDDGRIECLACGRRCKIPKNLHGFCGVRYNVGGRLLVANYGLFSAIALDPVEKKPLYHFYPGHKTLSLGTFGCSWACKFCINYDLSHRKMLVGYKIMPKDLMEIVKRVNTSIVTFTYNEPSIYSEYAKDFHEISRERGIKITWVTNGYLTEEARKYASKFLSAATIDLKGNDSKDFLRRFSLADDPELVLETIKFFVKKGIHVEITDLIVPRYGDNIADFENLIDWISDINKDVPLHILRFHPEYKVKNIPPTPRETLIKMYEIAKERLNYVYIGNLWEEEYNTTYCPNCGYPLIVRNGFFVEKVNLEGDRCPNCGYKINIVGESRTSLYEFPAPIRVDASIVEREIRNGKIVEKPLS